MLPNTIHLSAADQHYELAAACQREKDIWLTSIREALRHVPAWILEPLPSFMGAVSGNENGNGKVHSTLIPSATSPPLSSSASEDGHESAELLPMTERTMVSIGESNGLATIRSIPDICEISVSDVGSTQPHMELPIGNAGHKKQQSNDKVVLRFGQHRSQKFRNDNMHFLPSSRRSSSTSVKSIFSPINTSASDREREKDKENENEIVLVSRPSAAARQAVDIELQDIISAACLSARAKTAWKEKQEIAWGSSKTKLGSGVGSVGRGMVRLSKHESVRMARKRASAFPVTEGLKCVSELTLSPKYSVSNPRFGWRKDVKNLSLSSISLDEDSLLLKENAPPVTATPSSVCSSLSSPPQPSLSDVKSDVSPSETTLTTPTFTTSSYAAQESKIRTKRSRSFVRNVKGLFHFRPVFPTATSPISVIVSQPSESSVDMLQLSNLTDSNTSHTGQGLLHLFSKEPSQKERSLLQ